MDAFTSPLMQALGWTLLHSLWQLALLAVLLALASRLNAARRADVRYLLACAALAAALTAPALTFALVYAPRAVAPATDHLTEYRLLSPHVCPSPPQSCEPEPVPTVMVSQNPTGPLDLRALEPWLPYLALGWLAGVALLSLRLIALYLHAERFKRRHGRSAPAAVQALLEALSRKLGVRQRVRALESSLADSPLVIGVLRPVILLPTSALTGLTVQQLESILAHELAHVRRCDYLVNLLQSVAETLLFYHPAAWWISGRIRAEREHACDDLAVRATGNPTQYARALAQLEAMRQPQLALGASGGSLVRRIRRLIAPQPQPGSQSWLTSLGTLLSVLALSAALSLPQWVAAQERAAEPRPHLWATLFGLTVRLTEDANALEKIPNSGHVVLEERAGGQRRKMTVTQARSGEFLYAYELDGVPREADEEALEWYEDAFARSIGYVYRSTPGDTGQLSYRSFVRSGAFHSLAHVYQKHQFYEVMGAVSRRGEVLHGGELLTLDDPRFETHAEESVLNDIGRMTHLTAHDLLSYLPEVGDALTQEFVRDVLAHFVPTRKLSYALLELAAEIRTDTNKAEVLLELAPRLPRDARLAAAYRETARTLADETLRASVVNALP